MGSLALPPDPGSPGPFSPIPGNCGLVAPRMPAVRPPDPAPYNERTLGRVNCFGTPRSRRSRLPSTCARSIAALATLVVLSASGILALAVRASGQAASPPTIEDTWLSLQGGPSHPGSTATGARPP